MHYNSISKHILAFLIKNTTWEKMEGIFISISDHSVTCIGSSVESSADIIFLGQDVHKFSFAFIAPLGSEDHTESGTEALCAGLARGVT
jgi:hypothetical protein